ncbi:hypothetical protein JJD41_01035 [Oxynema sp. CENA135]|nr:hypothetical protein [Oxynema sp. CENA135]
MIERGLATNRSRSPVTSAQLYFQRLGRNPDATPDALFRTPQIAVA